MAKKGERVGTMGDSVYYRTPDGQIIDDNGNVIKGPMAKMMADEYEAKQQEKAKAQAEAKAAAEEAKRQKAADRAAEIARKASERQAEAEQKRQQAQAEREAAKEAKAQQQTPKQQAPRTQAPKQQPSPAAPANEAKQPGIFKQLATSVGQSAFTKAFPTFSGMINNPYVAPQAPAAGNSGLGDGGSRQGINRVADEINTTNMIMQTVVARQDMTNQLLGATNKLLGALINEVQQIKKPSLGGSILEDASDLLGMGGGKGKASALGAGKVVPKSGLMGRAAGGALRRAPLIGALLGGGYEAYDEYQESGNATRAASTGVGAAAGGGLGAWGGAATGAALGAFGGPVGIAIGGLLGAAIGGYGGTMLGAKAGRGTYDALATPSTPTVGPEASKDIKTAQAAKPTEAQLIENPKDSVVNVKTLTFNADNIVFNVKSQQNNAAAPNTPATAAGPTTATRPSGPSSLPLPVSQGISGPTQSGSVREALSSAQTPSSTGFGISQIQNARAGAATTSFDVTPGGLPAPRVQPNQGAMGAGAQTASLGPAGTGGMSDASAVQLASTMVGKSRTQSLDYLRAGGFNNTGEAWCAEFVNSTLKQTGGTGTGDKIANSFQKWGTQVDPTKVQAGDVVLQTKGHGPGQVGGHVGIATGVYQHGQIEMIAGNSKGGAVRKYFVPVNGQLQVRRGAGGSGNNPKVAEATRDPSAGNAAGAARASNPSAPNATPSPGATGGATSAGAGRGSVVEGLNDRAMATADAGAGRGNIVEGLNDRANAQMGAGAGRGDGSLEMAARAADAGAGAGRGSVVETAGARAASNAEQPAAVAAKLTPKESGVMTGFGGMNPQMKRVMDGMLQGFLGRSRGSQLIQASMRDMMSDRSARKGITVNQQHSTATPKTDTSKDRYSSGDVGYVEPVDARTRLKELFGIMHG